MGFEKIVNITPAFDKRSDVPSENYGVGACTIYFILKGKAGAVQFGIGTNWYPAHIQNEKSLRPVPEYDRIQPKGWDVGYHSPTPMYDGQSSMKCHILDGECYYDGSSLQADEWIPDFIEGGTEWLWPRLEKLYHDTFDETIHSR